MNDEISDYLDGRLGAEARAAFEERMRRDPALAREVAELRAIGSALREPDATPLREAATPLNDAFYARARKRFEQEPVPAAGRFRVTGTTWAALGAVAASVILVAVFAPGSRVPELSSAKSAIEQEKPQAGAAGDVDKLEEKAAGNAASPPAPEPPRTPAPVAADDPAPAGAGLGSANQAPPPGGKPQSETAAKTAVQEADELRAYADDATKRDELMKESAARKRLNESPAESQAVSPAVLTDRSGERSTAGAPAQLPPAAAKDERADSLKRKGTQELGALAAQRRESVAVTAAPSLVLVASPAAEEWAALREIESDGATMDRLAPDFSRERVALVSGIAASDCSNARLRLEAGRILLTFEAGEPGSATATRTALASGACLVVVPRTPAIVELGNAPE